MSLQHLQEKRAKIESIREARRALEQVSLSVRAVVNYNRLDIIFSEGPSEDKRHALLNGGWQYNDDGAYWYHADTQDNRDFIASCFDVRIIPPKREPESPGVVESRSSGDIVSTMTTPGDLLAFDIYKKQIDELIGHLKIGPADLQIRAISALHRLVFSRSE